jgi:hypothetical protein
MKRYFPLTLLFLVFLFPHLARALDMPFKQVAPGIYAFIGETGLRTYRNEGMNGNVGFIVTRASLRLPRNTVKNHTSLSKPVLSEPNGRCLSTSLS